MLTPGDESELAEAISAARGPLAIRGGGTRSAPPEAEVLSTSRLTGIVLYDPGALTLVARAGTPLSEIEEALAAERQRLAFEPGDMRAVLGTTGTSTIGGVAATNASGPRRIASGACRDAMLGVRLVDGTGAIVKNGGRVMKNVTGYDLVKLMAGSLGTLGVISEVAFKVLPATAFSATLQIEGLTAPEAVEAMSAALGSPFEVTGAAHLQGEPARTCLRIEGFEASVTYRAERLRALLGRFGEIRLETDLDAVTKLWRDIRDGTAFSGGAGDLWQIAVRPSRAPGLIEQLRTRRWMMDWGGGRIWAEVESGRDLRAHLGKGCRATLLRAAPATMADLGMQPAEAPAVRALVEGLRTKFDPRGVFSPHLAEASGA